MARRGVIAGALLGALAGCSPVRRARALPAKPGETAQGLAYGPGDRGRLDLRLPEGPPRALIVFLYGGAWQSGTRGTYAFVGRALAGLGCAVATPDYRLYPEVRWPVFLEDAARAVAWLRGSEGVAAGAPADVPLILMGHSAGAFIALALAADPRWLDAAGLPRGRAALAGAIGLAGPYDFTPREPPYPAVFAPAPGGRASVAVDATLPGTPPVLLLHGEADGTVEPAQTTRFAARLEAAGVDVTTRFYPRVGHIGIAGALADPLRRIGMYDAPTLADVAAFLERRIAATD